MKTQSRVSDERAALVLCRVCAEVTAQYGHSEG